MKPLKLILFCSSLFLLVSSKSGPPTFFPSQKEVTALMNEAMQKSDVPAVVAVAVNKNGEKIVYRYGKAIWTKNTEVTTEHIFRIMSMTKLLTSIAAMQCVENGLIALDDDLTYILPEMSKIPILLNGKLVKPKNKITLRHLLTHTSGFGYTGATVSANGFNLKKWKYKDAPRHFESGTDFLYGTSSNWVGKLVEKLTNTTLEAYFRYHITKPLCMNRTFFNVPDSLHSQIVSFGNRGNNGKQKLTESPNRIPASKVNKFNGGGGLFSTPSDYTKLLQCLLNEGKYQGGRILKKETILEMTKNQIGNISLNPKDRYFNSGSCCNFNGIMDENSKWGLAFMIDNNAKNYGRQSGTVLWGGYMNTYFYIDFKSGIAAGIYTQHIPFNHFATTSLFDRFSEIIYSKINNKNANNTHD